MAFSSSAPMAVVPSLSLPPRPALAPRQPRSRLALVAADVLMCLCFANSWIPFAGLATAVIGKRICGEDWPVAQTAVMVFAAAMLFSGLTFFASMLLLSSPYTEEPPMRMVYGYTIIVGNIVCLAFVLLLPVGMLLMGFPPDKRSRAGRIGSVMVDFAMLGMEFALWFITFPALALSMRRMRRDEAAQFEIKL